MINVCREKEKETGRQEENSRMCLVPCLLLSCLLVSLFPLSKPVQNQNGKPPMNHQIQVAAIDLDDTLLRSDGSISPRSLETLRVWRAAGNQIVIATGRPRRTVATVLPAELQDAP